MTVPTIDPAAQVVLCAGAPDTSRIAEEMQQAVADAQRKRGGVIWIQEMLPREATIQLYSHATVFCCPSIYEPFGIINLEAMACGTAVVASAVGGIVEVVEDGKTGIQVAPARSDELAVAIRRLLDDPAQARAMGQAGRRRVEDKFSWASVAERTEGVYADAIADFRRTEHD